MTTNLPPPADLENRAPEVARDPRGRVMPGHTPNPGGRPKAWREFQQAMRERSPEAVAVIDRALRSRDPGERRWAAERVLAYAWGRPSRRLQVGGDDDAPPVRVERAIDWSKLPPEQLRQLLEIADTLQAEEGADAAG